MVKHSFFQNSLCLNKYLHRFFITEESVDGVLEICEICKKKKTFKVIDDKLNNADYMSWHIRSALSYNHPYYYHEHSFNALEEDKIISPYV